jgi:hypothetical protein
MAGPAGRLGRLGLFIDVGSEAIEAGELCAQSYDACVLKGGYGTASRQGRGDLGAAAFDLLRAVADRRLGVDLRQAQIVQRCRMVTSACHRSCRSEVLLISLSLGLRRVLALRSRRN